MSVSNTFSRRTLLTCAALLIVVASIVAVAVIPQVKAEYLRGGTPMAAVYAFWVNVLLSVIVAYVLWFTAVRVKSRRFLSSFVLGLMSFLILLLGWSLSDAGSAYLSHGPEMQTAAIILIAGAIVYLIVLILVIIAAIRFPKQVAEE
ncbi:hypothetical protein KKC97_08250 [bacterium]|nr:hypothetical protein [bacterium]